MRLVVVEAAVKQLECTHVANLVQAPEQAGVAPIERTSSRHRTRGRIHLRCCQLPLSAAWPRSLSPFENSSDTHARTVSSNGGRAVL